jgi:hypothetical protein
MDDTFPFEPGMAVTLGGNLLRILKVHKGDYLDGSYTELLVVDSSEDATPTWMLPRYLTLVGDDLVNRSVEEWNRARSSSCSTLQSRLPASSSGSSSSPSSSAKSGTSSLDVEDIVARIRESMSKHPSDAAWYLLAHAEQDILDLVEEVKRLRGT